MTRDSRIKFKVEGTDTYSYAEDFNQGDLIYVEDPNIDGDRIYICSRDQSGIPVWMDLLDPDEDDNDVKMRNAHPVTIESIEVDWIRK